MSYNDGAPKNPLKIHDKRQAAHDFAEGNNRLENLLNYCFDNGILTSSCCAGHEQNHGTTKQYIDFYICKENESIIRHIIDVLYQKGYCIDYCFRSPGYPGIGISTNDLSSDMFKDILEAIKSYETQPITELSEIVSRIIANTAEKYDSIIRLEKKKEGVSVTFYIEYDYVEKTIPESELINFLNERTNSFYFDLTKKQSFPAFSDIRTKERMWQELQKVMQENNIEFTDPSEIDLTDWVGAFGKDTTIKKEIVVRDGDTIEIVAKKLDVLRDQLINAKAVINGVELTNVEYREEENLNNGRIAYINTFTKEKCIDQYYRELIEVLNKNLYSGELIVTKKEPLCLSFSNPYLSDLVIAERIVSLKKIGIKAWVSYPYIDYSTLQATDVDKTLSEIQKNKINKIRFEIIQILSLTDDESLATQLFTIYSQIDSNNLQEQFLKYRELICNSSINLQDIADNYWEANTKFNEIHKYLTYDTYVLYTAFKKILTLQKNDPVIQEILKELDTLALANIDTRETIERIIKKYRNYKENKQEFNPEEFQSNHRL